MPSTNFCPIAAATHLLGQRWTLLIIHFLHEAAPHRPRFCDLQAKLGDLNPATLSQRLKLLETEGLVKRVEIGALPPHVEYGLTRMGRELGEVIDGLNAWAENGWYLAQKVFGGDCAVSCVDIAASTRNISGSTWQFTYGSAI